MAVLLGLRAATEKGASASHGVDTRPRRTGFADDPNRRTFTPALQACLYLPATPPLRASCATHRGCRCPDPSDVHSGPPGLRSLDAGCVSGILPSLASNAASQGIGNPSRMLSERIQIQSEQSLDEPGVG